MTPLDLVKLSSLMELTAGRPDIMVGLIDGPVAVGHAEVYYGPIKRLCRTTLGFK